MSIENIKVDSSSIINISNIIDDSTQAIIRGCHITVHDQQVHVTIPRKKDGIDEYKLIFSKNEMRKLLEELFVS